ncbi:MAG: glycine zipper domain-containing protein [Gallionella sp.]|nr:glycine zipper domain-containing protein [Gallionella sp.]
MLTLKPTLILIFAALVLGGCASSMSGGAYTRGQARQVEDVKMATVESVRDIQIEGTKTPIGAGAGAIIGGVMGGNSNSRNVSAIGSVVGSVVGGMAGAAAEEGITRQSGYEITVKFDDGKMIAVAQGADEKFAVGDRVRVLTGGGVTRISH